MIKSYCPKCGIEVTNNDIRCPHCGMRIKVICRSCGALNDFGRETCSDCGENLIKYCKYCGTPNLPDADICRKCGKSLKKIIFKRCKPEIERTENEQNAVIEKNNNDLNNDNVSVINLPDSSHLNDISDTPPVLNEQETDIVNTTYDNNSDLTSADNSILNETSPELLSVQTDLPEVNLQEEIHPLMQEVGSSDDVIFLDDNDNLPQVATDNSQEPIETKAPSENSQDSDDVVYIDNDVSDSDVKLTEELHKISDEPIEILPDAYDIPSLDNGIPDSENKIFEESRIIPDEPIEILQEEEYSANIQNEFQNIPDKILNEQNHFASEPLDILNEHTEPLNNPNNIPDVPFNVLEESIDQTYQAEKYNKKPVEYKNDEEEEENSDDEEIIFIDDSEIKPQKRVKPQPAADNTVKEKQPKVSSDVKEPVFVMDKGLRGDKNTIQKDDNISDYSEAQELLDRLASLVEESDKSIIAVCAEEGMGKTTVLNALINSLSEMQILSLYSECSELTKIAPFGAIRDAFLRLLSLPDFHPDMQSFFGEQTKALFESNFSGLTQQEITDFMNFLYPAAIGNYSDIHYNKLQTYNLLENVIKSVTSNNNTIMIIDNYDLTDTSSYEFINNLVSKNIINENLKLIITYKEHKPAKDYFDERFKNIDIFETLYMLNMNKTQTLQLVQNFVNTDKIPEEVLTVINNNGKGNIFFAEQYLALLFDSKYIVFNQDTTDFNREMQIPYLPNNTEEVINLRINLIQPDNIKENLYMAAILGYKFDTNIFAEAAEYTPEQADEVLSRLTESMYIQKSTNYEFTFKNMTLWNIIYNEAQKSPKYNSLCRKIYQIIKKYGPSNVTVKAELSKFSDEPDRAAKSWKLAADTAVYLGDEYVYTLCCDRWLAASGYSETSEHVTDLQLNILETLGMIYTFDKPETAVKYLVKPILFAQKQQNIPKMIALSGYMVRACDVTNNFNGIIETIDMILTEETPLKPLQKAIILSKKMPALFALGNCEEAINLANNDLLPILEEALFKNNDDNEQFRELFDIWFEVSVYLANALSLQGNLKSISCISKIKEILERYNHQTDKFIIPVTLAEAFAHFVSGNINNCYKSLNSIPKPDLVQNKLYQSHYNIILCLAKIISGQSDSLKQKLFEYAMYSDDNFDIFGKHVFKMILARFLFLSRDYIKSIEIFNDELNFFAKEKIVTGALFCWLYIANINMKTGSIDSAESTALQALEVAQNTKFSQFHISIYLQKLLAEINMAKGDFEAAKMYIGKGMTLARQFNLEIAKVELCMLHIKLLRGLLFESKADTVETTHKIDELYHSVMTSLKNINLTPVLNGIRKEYSSFLNYCKKKLS